MASVSQIGSFAQGASDIGGAVSSLFGASGARSSAASYGEAARIADENAALTKTATDIKLMQEQRQIFKTLGEQEADVAGAGFAESGSAIDILKDSAAQGALTKATLSIQGAITENAYEEQANQFRGMEKAANTSSIAQTIGGLLQAGAGALNIYGGASTLFSAASAGATAGSGVGAAAGAAILA